jgi:hypothetical protein
MRQAVLLIHRIVAAIGQANRLLMAVNNLHGFCQITGKPEIIRVQKCEVSPLAVGYPGITSDRNTLIGLMENRQPWVADLRKALDRLIRRAVVHHDEF